MKLTIHDDPELLEKRLRTLKKLKTAKGKVGLPASAGGRLQLILVVQEKETHPGRRGAVTVAPVVHVITR